ncbi:MAG: MATE family efflux transporter [Myxococcales bacterium]
MSEFRRLLRLAGPIVLAQLGQMLLGVVDAALAGHLSTKALGAVTLGNLWQFGTVLPLAGVVMGLDPLVSQAHGAGLHEQARLALRRAVMIACALALPVCFAWAHAEQGLLLFGQDPQLAQLAGMYTRVQLFSVPCLLIYHGLSTYFTARGVVRPGLIAMVLANVFNAVVAYALIFGRFGLPAWGIWGGGLATGLTRLLSMLLLALMIKLERNAAAKDRGAMLRGVFDVRALWRQLALGAPLGVTLALEMWAFQIGTLLAGRLGPLPLSAHGVALNLSSISFMVPLGLGIASSSRVGQLIGAREPAAAQLAAQAALKLALCHAAFSATLFILARASLPRFYTDDHATVQLAASVLPIAGTFQVMDGLQTVSGGVLRGMGRPRVTAVLNLVGYFALGIPLAYYLGLRTSLGIAGIWYGYAAGLSVVAVGLVSTVLWRGPRHVRPL